MTIILYRGNAAAAFTWPADAKEALQHGWTEDSSNYVAVPLTQEEEIEAVALRERQRVGGYASTEAQKDLLARYYVANSLHDVNWRSMPSSAQDRYY